MNTELLIIFIALNIVNVIIQTVKSLATVKCGKTVAAIVNAVAYGLYTVVVVGACNLVGVFFVKWGEEKARKDKLWKVEATVKPCEFEAIKTYCEVADLPFSYIDIDKYILFNFYCATQKESAIVRDLLDKHNAKYFVSESKTL